MNTAPDPQDMTGAAEPGGSQPEPFTAYPHEGTGRLPVRLMDTIYYTIARTEINHFIDTRTK